MGRDENSKEQFIIQGSENHHFFCYDLTLLYRNIPFLGFLAALWILVDEVILQSFGVGMISIGGIAMGLNEIILGIWLMIKGFNEEAFHALDTEVIK